MASNEASAGRIDGPEEGHLVGWLLFIDEIGITLLKEDNSEV